MQVNGTVLVCLFKMIRMKFEPLENIQQLENIASENKPFIIFKHNTTCPISKSVKQKLEDDGTSLPTEAPCYLVNLMAHRDVSDAISQTFSIEHESPQLLVIRDKRCIFNQSLYNISAEDTARALQENNA